jgi:hypothetical protein
MYYNPNLFISSNFLLSALVPSYGGFNSFGERYHNKLLVGMYGNFHTLEISMEILQKTENGTTL